MLPQQAFDKFNEWLHICGSIIGHNILDPRFKFNTRTGLTVGGTILIVFSCLYTVYACDFSLSIQSIVVLLVAIQALVKSYCMISNRAIVLRVELALEELYKSNNQSDGSFDVMADMGKNSLHLLKAMMSLYCFTEMMFCFTPVMEFIWMGSLNPPLPTRLPGVDITSQRGFILLSTFHLSLLSIAGIGMAFFDGLVAILTFNLMAYSGLIDNHVKQLNIILLDEKHAKALEVICSKFRNILLKHKKMNE